MTDHSDEEIGRAVLAFYAESGHIPSRRELEAYMSLHYKPAYEQLELSDEEDIEGPF